MTDVRASCLIVSANRVIIPYPVYPLGAACLVGSLQKNGHEAIHFDLLADGGLAELAKLLRTRTFDLIGVSIRNLDSVDSAAPQHYLDDIVETMHCIRQNSASPVVLGGPAFSIMPELLLEHLGADYGVIGEGEILLPWLAAEIAAGRPPQKQFFMSRPDEAIWCSAEPSASSAKYYLDRGGMLNVQTKRGCPYNCSYCTYPSLEGKKFRFRDPEEVVDEFERLQKKAGAKYIFFTDSVFNDPQGRYLEIAEILVRRGNTLPWCGFFRPQNIGTSELQLLKRAGLAAMELGTDAGCTRTLQGLGKGFAFEDVVAVHERVIAENIPCAHFLIFGGPGENESTLDESLANVERLTDCVVFAFIGIRILPGTKIFDRAVEEGVISAGQSLLEPVFYVSPEVSMGRIHELVSKSFAGRLDRVYPCHEFEERVAMLHQMGHVGPLWDFILRKRRR